MKRAVLAAAGVAALALLPCALGNEYYVNLSSQVLIAAIFAMSLNILVGYGGLVSLGHAAYLGVGAYATAWVALRFGLGPFASGAVALGVTTLMAAAYGVLALRASGLGFLMITLALGQILWGLAYRWVSVTGGDNGLSGLVRPRPFGIDLTDARPFYYFTLVVFVAAFALIALFVRSPFGASLQGARDQPRRMTALGFHVWMIRWIAFVVSGFWGAVAGVLYVYYNNFISPHALSLTQSAEVLLMVIAGGPATLLGPLVGAALVVLVKDVASAYVERWTLLLGVIFVAIVLFLPDGLVPGVRRLWVDRIARRAP
ncbi:MAG TPA: branched-chain amino acid ABC transporter permease [Usitatibacter sp.]|nr:branched-chain amino acid ABC transporter permease [Usitatibacter sp.]